MNDTSEKEILKRALAELQMHTGLKKAGAIVSESSRDNRGYDFLVTLDSKKTNARSDLYIEVKKTSNNAAISQAAFTGTRIGKKLTIVTDYITQPQAEKLRELGIQFIDTAGNAFLDEPGIFVFITGLRKKTVTQRSVRIFRPPGMRVIYALLTEPGLESKSIRHISALTGVPTATVAVSLSGLEKQGFIQKNKKSKRSLTNKKELFRRFIEAYGESFRDTLQPVRYKSTKHEGRWWEGINISEYSACWGGETAGALLTGHLKPQIATIYAGSPLQKLQLKYGLIKDQNGEMEILRKFWVGANAGETAPPLIIYADLMATADRRNIETAKIIYEKYLTEIAETAS